MTELLLSLDAQLMVWLNVGLHSAPLSAVLPLFDEGDVWRLPLIALWLAVMVFGSARARWVGVGAIVVVLLTDMVSSQLLKPMIGRIRPCNVLSGIFLFKKGVWIVTPEPVIEIYKSSFAFPSGHATNAAGQAVWWSLWFRKQGWWLGPLAFLIGISRVYDGVHWPLDVGAGWIIGGVLAGLLWWVSKQRGPRALRDNLAAAAALPKASGARA